MSDVEIKIRQVLAAAPDETTLEAANRVATERDKSKNAFELALAGESLRARELARVIREREGWKAIANAQTRRAPGTTEPDRLGSSMEIPPIHVIRDAEEAALCAPCFKSRRGVVIFVRDGDDYTVVAMGNNGPPGAISCDGSEACRASCGRRCSHAEGRALDEFFSWLGRGGRVLTSDAFDLLHVKVDEQGRATPGGPPSCPQCAVRILDAGMGGVWLYESRPAKVSGQTAGTGAAIMLATWCRYTSEEYYRATMRNAGVYCP